MFNKPPKGPRKDWLTSATEPEAASRHHQERSDHAADMQSRTMGFDERLGRVNGTIVDLDVEFRPPAAENVLPTRPNPITAEEQETFTANVRAALRPEEPQPTGIFKIIRKFTCG